ncbi:hypothetical protein RHSIM_Rhsim10G0100700 [Rhododendron simsii]|uniref:Condensin-2 complex subunit G2 n=1 Tax=Rhododendron simsii TaxID=118357 RepID=A0A834GBW4_RHOSS|nr:hypothetical protein RHSIM_Rhsim10G0100700 [Rhododendron simsii]
MEKRLRSSLQTSAEEFLSSAAKLGFKSAKPSLKALIHSLKPSSSSSLSSSLPLSLHQHISQSITRFKQLSQPPASAADPAKSPKSPPAKRPRRSSRHASKNNLDDSGTKDEESKVVNERENVIQKLQIYTYVALLCVLHPKKVFSPSDLLLAVRELHDNLVLFESDPVLLSEVSSLCDLWWKSEFPGRETLISQSLPVLLSRSLTLKKKVDVHRVYAIREAFTLFDFDDESIEDLKLLLIRCAIAPLYLKTEDGRKFIAYMFGLSGQLLKEALAMIKSQIPFGRKSMLEAYGEILFRGWKLVEGNLRDEIENGFLQGLIEGAIHASSDSLAASIRRVLGGFIAQRTVDGVEKLLFRLAEPVIFRSLQVANSNVRQNALHLLLDLFPLEDPDSTKEVKDTLLYKQFFLLERLLMDDCPDVRVVAVEGSCRILHLFWEIIPTSTITKIITKIFDDMTHDPCNEVRLATLNGIVYLLGNPQSHEILKVLLPRLGHLILDSSFANRSALVDLLLLLRDIRSFQFHKVVHLDLLLSTLAIDQPSIGQKITKLLMPSYFPSKVTVEEACNRFVTLIKRSPIAGARFCEFSLSEGASLHSLMELVKVCISLVLSHNKLDGNQIDGLLAAIAYLCKSLVSEVSYQATIKELLSIEKLRCLFGAAATQRAQSSVCEIISCVSPDDIGVLFDDCMALVTSCCGLSRNMERQVEVRSIHKMMLSCNWFDKMFETLARILQDTAHGCHTKFGTEIPSHTDPFAKRRKIKSTKGKHVSGKKSSTTSTSSFEEEYSVALGIAWQIKDLLVDENSRIAMLKSQILEIAFFALKVISEVSIVQCRHCDYMDTSPIMAYTSLTLHMSLQNVSINGPTLLEQTMDHLFNCTNKLFEAGDTGNSSELPSEAKQDRRKKTGYHGQQEKDSEIRTSSPSDVESILSEQKRMSSTVKILTAVLKYIVDATAMGLISFSQVKCLKFSLDYVEFIMSNLKQQSSDKLQFKEEDFKDAFLCLKSSFTYFAKLLNLVLVSSNGDSLPPPEAQNLANGLLDLIVSMELFLGSGYATRVVAAMKPWLPDLILALGSAHIQKQTVEDRESEFSCYPLWLTIWGSFLEWKMLQSAMVLLEPVQRNYWAPSGSVPFKSLMDPGALLCLMAHSRLLKSVSCIFVNDSFASITKRAHNFLFVLNHLNISVLTRSDLGGAVIDGADFSDAVLDLLQKQHVIFELVMCSDRLSLSSFRLLPCSFKLLLDRDGFCDPATGLCDAK